MAVTGNSSGRRSKLPRVEPPRTPPMTCRIHVMILHICIRCSLADRIILPKSLRRMGGPYHPGGPVISGSPLEPMAEPYPPPYRPGGLHPCRFGPARFPGIREGGLFAQRFGLHGTRILVWPLGNGNPPFPPRGNPRVLGLP